MQALQGHPPVFKLGTVTISPVSRTTIRKWRVSWVDAIGEPGAIMVVRVENPETRALVVPQMTELVGKGYGEFGVDNVIGQKLLDPGAVVQVFRMMKIGNITGPSVRETLKALL